MTIRYTFSVVQNEDHTISFVPLSPTDFSRFIWDDRLLESILEDLGFEARSDRAEFLCGVKTGHENAGLRLVRGFQKERVQAQRFTEMFVARARSAGWTVLFENAYVPDSSGIDIRPIASHLLVRFPIQIKEKFRKCFRKGKWNSYVKAWVLDDDEVNRSKLSAWKKQMEDDGVIEQLVYGDHGGFNDEEIKEFEQTRHYIKECFSESQKRQVLKAEWFVTGNSIGFRFPYDLKVHFRDLFRSAKWNPHQKHWEIAYSDGAKIRAEQFIKKIKDAANES
ncbi:hypothetical protein [Stenotrophomonas maltophilia]|uniref:hypothetical protein n=1 Tax=Stenotrophomonas maltophilia TaxID=40324 RepID=UPI003BF79466